MNEPKSFTAGDTVTWTEALSDYLYSDGWRLSYRLSGPEQIDISAAADTDGKGHKITILASASANYAAGIYNLQAYVTKDLERYTVLNARLEIIANLAAIAGEAEYDARSHVKKVLDALQATIEGRATKAQSSITIAGRQLQYLSPAELRKEWQHYKRLYTNEQQDDELAKGTGRPKILTRFDSIT